MTSDEYWDEIGSIAREVTKEAREYDRDVYDVLHEMIDGHQWVIYRAYPPQVIALSDHPDAAWEEGLMEGVRSYDDTMITAAFCALRADVYDVINSIEEDDDSDEGEA